MERITSDKRDYGFSFLNIFYGKNEEIWVRGGGPAPEYKDCSLYDFIRRISKEHGVQVELESDEDLGWQLYDMLEDGPETKEGLIAFFNVAAIQAAEMREHLKEIEDILGDTYDIDHLRELVEADKAGRCVVLPCGVGDSVFHITTCKDFPKVLDGTMYGANGEPGTATGYYCPCELAENCPFLLEDGSFDCDKHKNTPAIYEDVVTEIVVNDMESFVRLDYSGCVDFDDFGKTVFRTREEAEAALEKMQEAAHE